ncbi:hypothetical protein [Cerasicoccus frondis]|uniref:hypothetical protein n=1 Tax=Cerasicoccus frondis TaxID=490090 RepID=UPI0028524D7E|nr:hypothetical protein [Cerasicoccus frondis]
MKTKRQTKAKKVAKKKTSTRASSKPAANRQAARLALEPVGTFEVKEFCQRYQLVRPDLTRLTGYSLRAVDQWATGKAPAKPANKQLAELVRLFDALSDLMVSKDVGPWLKASNEAFGNSTPLQVIERGEADRIWRMIYQLETGEPS